MPSKPPFFGSHRVLGLPINYQGMIFLRPFFFLLVDSAFASAVVLALASAGFPFGSGVAPFAGTAVPSWFAPAAGPVDVSELAAGAAAG
jgi:hypothetical protein